MKASCGYVSDDYLKGNDGYLFNDSLAVAYLLYEVGGYALLLEHLEHIVCHLVVDDALACDSALLLAVERCCVVLVVNDYEVGVVCGIDLLSLALIELFLFNDVFHFKNPP